MALCESGSMTNPVFPMFVGCGRSGTTLFRNVFDAHPDLAVTHEAHFVGPMTSRRETYERSAGFDLDLFLEDLFSDPNFVRQGLSSGDLRADLTATYPADFSDAVRTVFAAYARENGKALYGDKTPGSVNHISLIGSVFPETRFVHIIRDGRAVALSYLERPEWGPQTIQEAAHHWKSRVLRGREGSEGLGSGRYTEVRYEDMVESPEEVTRDLCGFLGLEFSHEMLRYHEEGESFIAGTKDPEAFKNLARPVTKGLRDWRDQMIESDRAAFESIAGDLLDQLGYEVSTTPASVSLRVQAAVSGVSWQKKRAAAFLSERGKRKRPRNPDRAFDR